MFFETELFKNKYEKSIIIDKLLSKLESGDITEEKLHQCIDYEISKPESEMNTDLIDLCTSTLCKLYDIEFKEIPMYKPWEEAEKEETNSEPVLTRLEEE